MDIEAIRKELRSPERTDYPELEGYSQDEIYEDKMGPGGLYLATQMARRLYLEPGARVLDLGCGRGTTSVFLASQFGVSVIAMDLWISASDLYTKFLRKGIAERVVPLNLDVTGTLPFAEGYFDAIFCMDALHYFGADGEVLDGLFRCLKSGGRVVFGSPCFSREFTASELESPPSPFGDDRNVWDPEFSRYHSPGWWKEHFMIRPGMTTVESEEIPDGVIMWEDDLRHNIAKGIWLETLEDDYRQVMFREEDIPHLTHFILTASRE